MTNNEEKDSSGKPIIVGDLMGNVVMSQNQSGGVTAHTINVSQEKQLNERDKKYMLDFIETIKI